MILARYPTDLTDTQWAVLAPFIPAAKAGGRPEWREDKAHLGVILRTVSVWCGAHLMAGFGK